MELQTQFCPNPQSPARGQAAPGHHHGPLLPTATLPLYDRRKTFAATTGTPFSRLHKDPAVFVGVGTLLAYGGPIPASVVAFGLDEPTVAAWRDRAVHHHFLNASMTDLQHVRADEICGHTVGGRCWLVMAFAVPDRFGSVGPSVRCGSFASSGVWAIWSGWPGDRDRPCCSGSMGWPAT